MKKVIFLTTMLLAAFIGFSQGKIQFGVHAGANLAGMKSNSNAINVGLNGGVEAPISVARNFVVQPELSYALITTGLGVANGNNNNDVVGVFVQGSYKLDYLSVPVLLKYQVPNTEGLGIYIGPQYSYLLSGAMGYFVNGQINWTKVPFTSSDVSGIFGAEFNTPQGYVSARYQLGFTDVVPQVAGGGASFKNSGFTLTVGYRF
jgi:hypothetical protein